MSQDTVQIRRGASTYAYVIIANQARAGTIFQLKKGLTTIGRSGSNDIRLDEPSVSSEHAQIRSDGEKEFTLIDLGSANGARLNGRPVQQHILRHNDVVELGETKLVFKRIG